MGAVLYPTKDFNIASPQKTASFFVIDTLGGIREKFYTNAQMTNKPALNRLGALFNFNVFNLLAKAKAIKSAFSRADTPNSQGHRQVYEIAELGIIDPSKAITPEFMRISAVKGQLEDQLEGKNDFRDELKVENFTGRTIVFNIEVGHRIDPKNEDALPFKKNQVKFTQIGTITYDASVVSETCDFRFHVPHPTWRIPSEGKIKHFIPKVDESIYDMDLKAL